MARVLLFLYIPTLLLLSVSSYAQNKISGEIKNLRGGKLQLILEEDINRKRSRSIAEIPVDTNGRFDYTANLSPNIYSLKINNNRSLMLAIDKDQKILIDGDMKGSGVWNITGSPDTKILMAYEVFRKASLDRLVNSVRREMNELKNKGAAETDTTLLKLTRLEVTNYERHRDELMDFVKNEMGTSLAVYATSIRWSGDTHIPFLSRLAKEFEQKHPGTDIAARLNEKVKILSSNSIGGKVANIIMPDKDSIPIQLTSVKAKYILIDFWASWCLPCRRESPLMNQLYEKYKAAGLKIFSVNLDTNRDSWLKAVEKDRRGWINVSTLQGFETPVCFDYAVTSLPANVLIDASGKVIAKNLHGDSLKEQLEKLFSDL